jgi:uncharacterized delta-60 repeat protein
MPDGTLDPTFGSGGIVTTAFDGIGSSVVVQPDDGKIVVGGTVPGGAMEVARFNPDGALDASFGNAGRALISFCSLADNCLGGEAVGEVALDAAHRIVIAGYAGDPTVASERFAVARLLPDGSLDATFGTAGKVRTRLGNPTDRAFGTDVAIQNDGRIVVAGTVFSPPTGLSFGLARYLGPLTQTLTVTVSGQGSVSSTPPGIGCPTDCSEAYAGTTPVTLSATPAAGWTFASWSGGGCSGPTTCTITVDQDQTVVATFNPVPMYTLTVAPSGQGSVSSTPPGVACPTDCSEAYPEHTPVTLTATPAAGWTFANWSGGGCSGASTCTITMDQDQTVTATFNLGACTNTGTPGNDVLTGTSSRDTICGLGGNDIINGLGGDDLLLGGPGNDDISGGAGLDHVDGGTGSDTINGSAGNDVLEADDGNDRVNGGAGNDDVTGGAGNDRIDGGPRR